MTKKNDLPDPGAPNDVLGVWPPTIELRAEVTDAMWADFGRRVSENIFHPEDFAWVLTHGSMKAKSTRELLGFVRAYILTGVKP